MTVLLPAITETDLTKINLSIQQLGAGRSNATGSVTLAINSGTTVVDVNNNPIAPTVIALKSVPILVPITANAAAEVGNGTMYISAIANGSFTISHANSATTGRTFLWAIVG